MIEALKGLLKIESVADHGAGGYPYGPGPAAALDYVLNLCAGMGMRTKNADYRYGYAEIGQGEELIGILCHLDVVPAGDGWHYPPFDGTEEGSRLYDGRLNDGKPCSDGLHDDSLCGGRLYGRGTLDDKGPAIANIYAMKDLLDSGKPLNKRIRIIFGQTEENGDWYDMDAYKKEEELPGCGYTPDGDFPAIYVEKGIMLVKLTADLAASGFARLAAGNAPNMVPDFCRAVTADGASYETRGKSAHGSAPWAGENALTKMMEQLADKAPLAKMYMDLLGYDVYGGGLGCDLSDEASGRLSVNCGLAKVEEDGNGRISLYLDIRHPVSCTPEQITETIRAATEPYGVSAECVHTMQPVYLDKEGPVMNCLLSAYRDVTGDMSEPLIIGGGTYARAMDNIIAFGPNFPGHENREHKEDEYILTEDFLALREIYRKALEGLLRL